MTIVELDEQIILTDQVIAARRKYLKALMRRNAANRRFYQARMRQAELEAEAQEEQRQEECESPSNLIQST